MRAVAEAVKKAREITVEQARRMVERVAEEHGITLPPQPTLRGAPNREQAQP